MIPEELKKLKQFACADSDKVPRTPNGDLARVNDPKTWATYEECLNADYPHVGFIVRKTNKLVLIDLDDHEDNPATDGEKKVHKRIIQKYKTYTERSLSGRGYHLITRGKIPRNIACEATPKIALFNDSKFFILTGNTLRNRNKIEKRQKHTNELFEKLSALEIEYDWTDGPERYSDQDLILKIANSQQGVKFEALSRGVWQNKYPSQSEADSAWFSIIAYWTKNNEQAKRIFRLTKLGQRKKALRDAYLDKTLAGARGLQPQIDRAELDKLLAQPAKPAPKKVTTLVNNYVRPPGMLGELSDYFLSQMFKPIHEGALLASLALYACIVGRAYNISSVGLNLYMILLARTGMGKEGMAQCLNHFWYYLSKTDVVELIKDRIGPAHYASGQAILRTLDTKPSILSVVGEFGQALAIMCDPHANAAEKSKKLVLLDAFSKSGISNVINPAAYSDSTKNTKPVISPNLNILGESTPTRFMETLSLEQIEDGLGSRFLVLLYDGERLPTNKQAFKKPLPKKFKKHFNTLIKKVSDLEVSHKAVEVLLSETAEKLMDEFDRYCDNKINKGLNEIENMLYNRGHLKALKLAAIVAAANNIDQPVIDTEIARWSITFVNHEIKTLMTAMKNGVYSNDDNARINAVKSACLDYCGFNLKKKKTYKPPALTLKNKNIIPYAFLRQRLTQLKIFKLDRLGATKALQNTLFDMCRSEILIKIPDEKAFRQYKATMPLYVVKEIAE